MKRIAMAVTVVLACGAAAGAQTTTEQLKRMSIEDVLNIEVTTVSRVPEPSTRVPAAVYVITRDDIRRSGALSIPEVLRLAPGVQVARISAGVYAIGIRGFADRLARSILVMIDGRAVYSPLFAGTYWEVQDTLLNDIDRIEVIRGPGGTLWGANAVNGIINIITKTAGATQGAYASIEAGNENPAAGSIRYGGHAGSADYRVYGKAFDRASQYHGDGNDFDHWRAAQGGFRADWSLANQRAFTVQGDIYDGRLGERPTISSYTAPFITTTSVSAPLSGGNVLARWSGQTGNGSDFQLQAYYDRTNRDEIPVAENRDTGDVDFQQTLRQWRRHAITWGAEYRVTSGRITAVPPTAFLPSRRTDHLYTAFAQDELAIVPDRWRLTFGAKLEHNDYSGFEAQPSVRILWTPGAVNTVWGAMTSAVRTPSRVETDYTTVSYSPPPPIARYVRLEPDPGFVPERLTAYELGYRARPAAAVFLTVSAFYNHLENLLSTELLTPFVEASPPPVHLVIPVDFGNGLHGDSTGVELTADIRPARWARLNGNYSYETVAVSRNPGSADVTQEKNYEGTVPHHQVQAQVSVDLSHGWSADWLFRYVSVLTTSNIPSYATWNFRVGRQLTRSLEVTLAGQDLGSANHVEWPSGTGANIGIERSVYARITWRR